MHNCMLAVDIQYKTCMLHIIIVLAGKCTCMSADNDYICSPVADYMLKMGDHAILFSFNLPALLIVYIQDILLLTRSTIATCFSGFFQLK